MQCPTDRCTAFDALEDDYYIAALKIGPDECKEAILHPSELWQPPRDGDGSWASGSDMATQIGLENEIRAGRDQGMRSNNSRPATTAVGHTTVAATPAAAAAAESPAPPVSAPGQWQHQHRLAASYKLSRLRRPVERV